MDKEKTRPVTVRIEQFREDLNQAVTRSELPAYMLEVFLQQYLLGIQKVADQEYAQGREEWKQIQKENTHPEKDRSKTGRS